MKKSNVRTTRRDYSRWRAGSLIAVHLLIGLHIAHWLATGQTLAPLEFNEVLHTLHLGIITAGFLFMALTIVGTLVAGRFFCSWGCHILALQDLSAWLLDKLEIRPQPIRSRTPLWALAKSLFGGAAANTAPGQTRAIAVIPPGRSRSSPIRFTKEVWYINSSRTNWRCPCIRHGQIRAR